MDHLTTLHHKFTQHIYTFNTTDNESDFSARRWHSSILWSILAITHCSHDPSWHQADKTSCHHQLWSLASLVTWHLTITTQLEKEWLVRTIETMTPDCGEVSAILESHWQSNIYNWVSGVECIKEFLTTSQYIITLYDSSVTRYLLTTVHTVYTLYQGILSIFTNLTLTF